MTQSQKRLRIVPNQIMHISRRFEGTTGRLSISLGQELRPEDQLGEGEIVSGFKMINLPVLLGVSSMKAQEYLKKKIGQTIYKGELLAKKPAFLGLGASEIVSPSDGILQSYDPYTGNLRLQFFPKKEKLLSGVYGIVEQIDHHGGEVMIKTLATVIYGMIGSGRQRGGLLSILEGKETLVSSRQIGQALPGQILVGGSLLFPDALRTAAHHRVSGIISGGINAEDFKTVFGGNLTVSPDKWTDVGFTLMITEGFGGIPIGDDIFKTLQTYHDRFVVLDGNTATMILPSQSVDSMIYIRKTSADVSPDHQPSARLQSVSLAQGNKVRLVNGSRLGTIGIVQAIDQATTQLPSGIKTTLVTIKTSATTFKVPLGNLEVID
jgi:hypothetical protein